MARTTSHKAFRVGNMEEFRKNLEQFKIPSSLTWSQCLAKMDKLSNLAGASRKASNEMLEYRHLYLYMKFVEYLARLQNKGRTNADERELKTEFRRTKQHMERYEELKRLISERESKEKSEKEEMNKQLLLGVKSVENNINKGPPAKLSTQPSGFLKCNQLYSLLTNEARKEFILIFDLRSAEDFKESRVRFGNTANIPDDIISLGMSASVLGKKLSGSAADLWAKRGDADILILMDWWSSSSSLSPSSKVFIMRNIMQEWDVHCKYKSTPVILDGGVEELIARYPQIMTNPKVVAPQAHPINNNDLNDLDYPMEELEPAKPKPKPVSIPPSAEPTTPKAVPPVLNKVVPDKSQPHITINRNNKPVLKTKNVVGNINQILDEVRDSSSPDEDAPLPTHLTSSGGDGAVVFEPVAMDDVGSVAVDSTESSDDDSYEAVSAKPTSKVDEPELKKPDAAEVENLRKLKPTTLTQLPRRESREEGITYQPLKGDGFSSGGLHRTSSSPNIAQMRDDEPTHQVPAFTRANKPPAQKILSPDRSFRESALSRPDTTYGRTSPGLTGLKNFANNCYMNSILQCLNNTRPLVDELLRDLQLNNTGRLKGRIAHEVILTFRMMWSGEVKVFSIKELKSIMGDIKDMFKGSMHQDSNEFLIILLEHLHEELKVPADVGTLAGAVEKTGEKAWGEFRRNNCSVIQRLFYGQHKSTVMCNTCNHTSETFEQFLNLFVPIPSNVNDVRLEDCIQAYMSGERINGWKCPTCKVERNAVKKFDISRLPPILVIALKRFTHENDSWLHKKENLVSYPLENLDMSRFTLPSSEQRHKMYNLYAMSTHTGTLLSGHYRAICKNHLDKRWYMFDDQSVEYLSESSVMRNSEVYILFYVANSPVS